ncbi:uncharacterized protein LOC135160045 [Diachasmimorpha longicaudata]|uniref:uncharacterized protein LOC135160045 n=1 Tax=Diachasmimorpha longicaudata TaxID=58733 RepID=UPI0030B8F9D3
MVSTPTRVNVFLQRILRKNEDEPGNHYHHLEAEEAMVTNSQPVENSPRGRSKWLWKFGASTSKNKSPNVQITTPMVYRSVDPMPIKRAATLPTPQAAQDLGKIVNEFEKNYLSPAKQMTHEDARANGEFVKRMVAALEEKCSNLKTPGNEMANKRWQRRSMPSVSECHQESNNNSFNETYLVKSSDDLDRRSPYEDDLSASFNALDTTVDISQASFTSMDLTQDTFTEVSSTPVQIEANLPRPIVPSPSPSSPPLVPGAPKIVGAFLKKPIEVEDTAIDWIPITGKKLPRKHSFKKLLSILTGRSFASKGSKLFGSQSQSNIPEENRKEHHDSGYDEKSSSTSSLKSLTSFPEVAHQQENYGSDTYMRTGLSTFQALKDPESSLEGPEDQNDADTFSDAPKIVFEEIPRSEVRLSLGPSFPLKSFIMRQRSVSTIASEDINDLCLDSDEDSLDIPPLPKHPYISSKDVLDDSDELSLSNENVNQAKLRGFAWKFLDENWYDTPRSYLSRSEPGLCNNLNRSSNLSFEEHVYDVPSVKLPPRPKSSVYEDALSLKRRNAYMAAASIPSAPSGYYGCQQEEPHYATVKPRNRKIVPSQDLLRSMSDLHWHNRGGTSHYCNLSLVDRV